MMLVIIVSVISALCVNNAAAITYYWMEDYCNGTVDISYLDAIRLQLSSSSTYKPNMACSLLITSNQYSDRFMLFFKNMDIEYDASCKRDWLEVHDGTNIYSPYVSGLSGRLCGSYVSSTVKKTSGNNLYLFFKSDNSWQNTGFDMVITQYHTGFCYSDEFSCNNGRCVSESLICNGYNPCGDHSDCAADIITGGVIAGIILGSCGFSIILVTLIIVGLRRRRRRLYGRFHQPVNVVPTTNTNYGTGYNQTVPQQYPAVSPPGYPTGQQLPPSQYPNQPYPK